MSIPCKSIDNPGDGSYYFECPLCDESMWIETEEDEKMMRAHLKECADEHGQFGMGA